MSLTPTTEGLVMSVLLVGAAIGSVFGGTLADYFGRRKYLLCLSFIFLVGALMSALAPDITVLLLSRFLLGYAVGGASVTAPTFISEVAPTEMRGKLTGLNEVAIVIGQLAAFAINAVIGIIWGHLPDVWRYMLMVQAIPAICLFVGMLRSPESPRWLVGKQQAKRAEEILVRVGRTGHEAAQEVKEIGRLHQDQQSSWRELFQPWVRPALVAGLGIAIFSQATGISAIIYYAPSLLVMAQFGKSVAILGSVGIGVVLTVFTLLGIWLLDVLGRRRLMLIGLPGAVVVLAVMSMLLPWSAHAQELLSDGHKIIVLACLLGYFAFNGGSLSVVTWLYCAEIFPLGVRGKGTALCSFALWVVNFLVTLLLYFTADALGIGLVFGALAAVNALAWVFVWRYAPETRGRTLEDIEQSLLNGQFNARNAASSGVLLNKINSD